MKHIFLTVMLAITSVCAFALNPTEADKKRCYMENSSDSTITFLYPMGSGYFSTNTNQSALYVYGSMTAGAKTSATRWHTMLPPTATS